MRKNDPRKRVRRQNGLQILLSYFCRITKTYIVGMLFEIFGFVKLIFNHPNKFL